MDPCFWQRPWLCRIVAITVGLALFWWGVHLGERWGLVLMIIGLVPAVTGIADVSLVAEIRVAQAERRGGCRP